MNVRMTEMKANSSNQSRTSSFALRQKLLPNYCGLRDEELSNACGIPECIFVHISGFLGINKTREGALQMAIQSLSGSIVSYKQDIC